MPRTPGAKNKTKDGKGPRIISINICTSECPEMYVDAFRHLCSLDGSTPVLEVVNFIKNRVDSDNRLILSFTPNPNIPQQTDLTQFTNGNNGDSAVDTSSSKVSSSSGTTAKPKGAGKTRRTH